LSKFGHIDVNGGNNQFGDNNTQNNTTNHHHHNNGQGSNGDEGLPILIGVGIGLLALVWWFFNHINQVYHYLNILTLSSVALASIASLLLLISRTIEKEDVFRFIVSLFLAVGLFGLAMLSREHAPNEIIQLSQQTKFMAFWQGLTDYGKSLVISNFISAIAIYISAFVAHLASLRQFSYALANPNGSGFWFSIYRNMGMFKMRISVGIISICSGLVWAALTGKLASIYA